MKLDDKIKALNYLLPGCQYVRRGDEFEWLDERPMPTEQEIESALPIAKQQELLRDYTNNIQSWLDEVPKERGYMFGIIGLISYETDPDPVWAAEAEAGKLWRNAVHKKAFEIMGEVQAGTRPIPTWEELKAELPTIVWPIQTYPEEK